MRIIISPAKQMRVDTDSFACTDLPVFMDKTEILKDWISGLKYEKQKALWACNDKIARQNAERFADMDLYKNLTPAILAYDGIQYTYMVYISLHQVHLHGKTGPQSRRNRSTLTEEKSTLERGGPSALWRFICVKSRGNPVRTSARHP